MHNRPLIINPYRRGLRTAAQLSKSVCGTLLVPARAELLAVSCVQPTLKSIQWRLLAESEARLGSVCHTAAYPASTVL